MRQASKADTVCCAVCGIAIPRGRLMCRAHWRQVPVPLQNEVWTSWSRFLSRKSPTHALQTLTEYRKAAQAATEYVAALQGPADPQTQLSNCPPTKETP